MNTGTTAELLHLLAPLVALGAMVAGHATLCRIRPNAPILNLLITGGFLGLGGLFVMQGVAVWVGQSWSEALGGMVLVDGPIFICLAYGYANFVNLGHASLRIRIYRELQSSRHGILISELRAKYDEVQILSNRLQRMINAGDIKFDGAVYRLNKLRLLAISHAIFMLKRVVLGRQSEFFP